jgi:hypothetical protein
VAPGAVSLSGNRQGRVGFGANHQPDNTSAALDVKAAGMDGRQRTARGHRPASRFLLEAPSISLRGGRGASDDSAVGMTVRLDTERTRKSGTRMAQVEVFGANRGSPPGAVPAGAFRGAFGRAGWIRDKARICRKMHEQDASATASVRGWNST